MPDPRNVVAHSGGAVCCPDEASARSHRDRATWVDASQWREHALPGGLMAVTWLPAARRWNR